ncbi:AttT protein [Asanoa ishikariensis]|uniref:Acetyltransferase (GNAT) domain-containing protein n=1 Tax=Asanoa ishikariensis TaxID=137265 RepID=A0A1H3ULZ7_9ACTN|nr:GNAT family N-acetyltransferase [Asanoa ishikariensis]GIF69941.1 AttT protein [Asanoa ishikariensis]SDZ63440.1 Acetyltransferase (GNAT) domain-containing protein [Asanoa ishikariensis]
MTYVIRHETPSPEVYRALRVGAGMTPKSPAAAAAGLPGTWHAVVVHLDDQPIGMGRVIGDGGTAFQIVDVCVLPEHQGRGVGKTIMSSLIQELRDRAPSTAYVSLIADGDARHLYEKFGFTETAPESVGMALVL